MAANLTASQVAALAFLAGFIHPVEDYDVPNEYADALYQLIDRGYVEVDYISGTQSDGAEVDLDFWTLTEHGRRWADRAGLLAHEDEPTQSDLEILCSAW